MGTPLTKEFRRHPYAAGSFFPGRAERLRAELEALYAERPAAQPPRKALAVLLPHAGIMYSGAVAAAVLNQVAIPRRSIIIAPNHTGLGAPASIIPRGVWETPLGDVPIDAEAAELLLGEAGGLLEPDPSAHLREHAVEVIVPFLQFKRPDAAIVPLVLARLSEQACARLGAALAKTLAQLEDAWLIISSDMTHFETRERCRERDDRALEQLLKLDAAALQRVVEKERISMCGYIPACVGIQAALARGGVKPELLAYDHSSRVTGQGSEGVAYAGIAFFTE